MDVVKFGDRMWSSEDMVNFVVDATTAKTLMFVQRKLQKFGFINVVLGIYSFPL